QNIPSSRDPWVVLQTVPGVIVDRVNVGGAESGQQSAYQAKGASGGENTWNMDGVAITDMAALGSTPTYYDFDMFQEMQVTTGGADVSSPTPGVQLNMVLKSGSNTPHGSSRIYFENEGMQSKNLSADLAAAIGGTTGKGSRMHQYKDYGFELGGPILRNRVWAWGAAGKTHVDLITLAGSHDRTELQDTSFKGTGQVTSGLRTNFTFFRGNKEKFGRGAGPTVSDESSYNQTGPTSLYKGEGNLVIGNSLFLSAKASHVKGGFQLAARGGPTTQMYIDDGGDTMTWDRLTLNLGLRWDRQAASLGAASVPGSSVLPSLLPALTATPAKNAVVWNAVTPRIGVNIALDENRKSLVRASYAMFASQLGATAAGTISAIQYSAIYYYATDLNGNKIADPNEIEFGLGNIGYYGFDPTDPSRLTTINQIGKYKTPLTHEVLLGADHELLTNFGISGTVTWRYFQNFNWSPLIGVTSANYHQTGTLTANADPIGSFS